MIPGAVQSRVPRATRSVKTWKSPAPRFLPAVVEPGLHPTVQTKLLVESIDSKAPHCGRDFSRIPIHLPAGAIRAKLAINRPGDQFEQEADRIADQVIALSVQPGIGSVPLHFQRFHGETSGQTDTATAIVNPALASMGSPLHRNLREEMELCFGYDFSQVRVHTDTTAGRSARGINARAFTVGRDIVFGAGCFAPGTREGRRLLAHELTHVVQQTGESGTVLRRKPEKKQPDETADPLDEDAYPDYAWYFIAKTGGGSGTPGKDVIRVVIEQNSDINPDLLDVAVVSYKYRNAVKNGTIRPSYFVFRHPSRGVILRAFAELEGFHPQRKPSPRELLKGGYSYNVYAFMPSRGNGRPRYNFYAPLASAPSLADLEKEAKNPPAAAAPASPQPRSDPWNSLAYMMVRWKAAGLLDAPNLPPGVAPIPPLPVSQKEAEQVKADLSRPVAGLVLGTTVATSGTGTGAATGVAAAGEGAVFAEGTGSWAVSEGAVLAEGTGSWTAAESTGATLAEGAGTAVRTGAGATAAGVAAGLVVILYESPSAPMWTDLTSDVTSQPYTGPDERAWDVSLDPAQTKYLKDLWDMRYQPPAPKPELQTDKSPAPTTQTEPEEDKRNRPRRCSPTGFWPDDAIPIVWFKPQADNFYPASITIQGHRYRRDTPSRLPHGEPIGVRPEYWPRIGKQFQLLPESRGSGADDFRAVLQDYGFNWEGLQADHVQDLQWSGPDRFENLWPLDMRQNLSAGSRQNNLQVVGICLSPRGPYVTRSILDLKRARGFYGRWFEIARVET